MRPSVVTVGGVDLRLVAPLRINDLTGKVSGYDAVPENAEQILADGFATYHVIYLLQVPALVKLWEAEADMPAWSEDADAAPDVVGPKMRDVAVQEALGEFRGGRDELIELQYVMQMRVRSVDHRRCMAALDRIYGVAPLKPWRWVEALSPFAVWLFGFVMQVVAAAGPDAPWWAHSLLAVQSIAGMTLLLILLGLTGPAGPAGPAASGSRYSVVRKRIELERMRMVLALYAEQERGVTL